MPSNDSSPVETRTIPCANCKWYLMKACKAFRQCVHAFVPADAETVKRHDPLCPGLPESEHLYCNCPAETASCPPACAEAHTYSGSCLLRSYRPPPVSAERLAETAGEPEAPPCLSCGRKVETWFDRSVCAEPCGSMHDRCSACGVTTEPCPNEPEAPECDHPSGCQFKDSGCVKTCAFGDQLKGIAMMPRPKAAPPRRPPYAVAYALASGELYEVALPGDAVATVEDGVLKISHAAGVAYIVQVKPMGTT